MNEAMMRGFHDELEKLSAEDPKQQVIDWLGDRPRTVPQGVQKDLEAQLGSSQKFWQSPQGEAWLRRTKRLGRAAEGRSPLQWIAKKLISAKATLRRGVKMGSGEDAFVDEIEKLSVSPGKAVEAIFHRVYKGKQIIPTINRMAKGYLETAERMGSPVTREGAKAWIKQVQKTKSL